MTKRVPTRPNRRRRGIFVFCAVTLGLLPFFIVEFVLRAAGLGAPSSYTDPYVAFSQSFPLFEYDSSSGNYQIAKHHDYFFGRQWFPRKKAAKTFRVFCLGGSTVLGHPYETPTAFPKWLELELNARVPSTQHEIINCGGMSYASYRLIPILEEVLTHQADLVIVATGHNEFLEDRTYHQLKQRTASRQWIDEVAGSLRLVTFARQAMRSQRVPEVEQATKVVLSDRVDAKLDHASGYASYRRDPQWWNDIAKHHALNLRVMVRLCREAGVPVVLVNPGSNLRDCPPFKSEHRGDISTVDLARWNQLFHEGETLEVGKPQEALTAFEKAKAIDDEYALLHYRIARCLDRLDRNVEARSAYAQAKDLDVCPLRMIKALEKNMVEVASSTSTPLVDAARLLHEQSRFAMAGADWYVDHVHPNIHGHQLIAQAIVNKLIEAQLLPDTPSNWSKPARRAAYRTHIESLSPKYWTEGRRRLEWLDAWARRHRLQSDTLPVDTRGLLELGNGFVEFGERAESKIPYETALHGDPAAPERMLHRALQLFRNGRNASALTLLKILETWFESHPPKDAVYVALAVVLFDSGQSDIFSRYRSKVEATYSDLDDMSKAWLDELPFPEQLFDSMTR